MGLLSLLSVVILSVYIIFPEKVRYFYFKRCRKVCQGFFFHFAKIIIFSENLFFSYCFFFSLFAPTFVAFASTFVAFASTTKFAWEHHKILENPIEKAFTFWAFLSQRVHRFTSFVTFWWIPVKGGFTPWIPSVYRASSADVKGEPSFLALYACAKEIK